MNIEWMVGKEVIDAPIRLYGMCSEMDKYAPNKYRYLFWTEANGALGIRVIHSGTADLSEFYAVKIKNGYKDITDFSPWPTLVQDIELELEMQRVVRKLSND